MSDTKEASQSTLVVEASSNTQAVYESPKKKITFRKRRYTVGSDVTKTQASKKRRKDNFGPPTVFLLGGNIHDPLNLKSIDSNIETQNRLTLESSPLPNSSKTKVEVLIPANIRDPLNLAGPESPNTTESSNLKSQTNFHPLNKRNKRRRTSSETEIFEKQSDLKGFSDKKFKDDSFLVRCNTNTNREKLTVNKTVPAAIPPVNLRPSRNFNSTKSSKDVQDSKDANTKSSNDENVQRENTSESAKSERFQYGNYNRYYGYRNIQECDPRIELFEKDLFDGKDVLDIGCNVGHVTLTIARDFAPKKIVGIDIDPKLISIALKNIRHYVTEQVVGLESFPISMPILFGPIPNMPPQCKNSSSFPYNVFFASVNYVPDDDECLANAQAEYDCILCLSLTKWIHLNWGDDGVKRLFRRIFLHLRPGGVLILEPQSWSTYSKKAKLTAATLENFRSIRFKPEQFNEYLLKDVGFKSCELLGTPEHISKGFQRPIYLYTKAKV